MSLCAEVGGFVSDAPMSTKLEVRYSHSTRSQKGRPARCSGSIVSRIWQITRGPHFMFDTGIRAVHGYSRAFNPGSSPHPTK